ncbi:AraC-like DNA-binding protein [Xanthomonas translucens]
MDVKARQLESQRSKQADAIRRSIRYMSERLEQKTSLDELAAAACISPFHFVRVFQSFTGVPPARFLGALRLQRAKELLISTEHAILDICQDVGYDSLGTFSRRFTHLVGLAPGRFRDLYNAICAGAAHLAPPVQAAPPMTKGGPLHGRVHADVPDDAVLFVGLFRSRIPQHMPLSCDVLRDRRDFALTVPNNDGGYHVLAVALRNVATTASMFDNRDLICAVGASPPLSVATAKQTLLLQMRAPDLLDPPVLVAFPMLSHLRLAVAGSTRAPSTAGAQLANRRGLQELPVRSLQRSSPLQAKAQTP